MDKYPLFGLPIPLNPRVTGSISGECSKAHSVRIWEVCGPITVPFLLAALDLQDRSLKLAGVDKAVSEFKIGLGPRGRRRCAACASGCFHRLQFRLLYGSFVFVVLHNVLIKKFLVPGLQLLIRGLVLFNIQAATLQGLQFRTKLKALLHNRRYRRSGRRGSRSRRGRRYRHRTRRPPGVGLCKFRMLKNLSQREDPASAFFKTARRCQHLRINIPIRVSVRYFKHPIADRFSDPLAVRSYDPLAVGSHDRPLPPEPTRLVMDLLAGVALRSHLFGCRKLRQVGVLRVAAHEHAQGPCLLGTDAQGRQPTTEARDQKSSIRRGFRRGVGYRFLDDATNALGHPHRGLRRKRRRVQNSQRSVRIIPGLGQSVPNLFAFVYKV